MKDVKFLRWKNRMVRDKVRICPKCNMKMKFRGNRIWHCIPCHETFQYFTDVEYETDEDGNVKTTVMGKPKVKKRQMKMKSWYAVR